MRPRLPSVACTSSRVLQRNLRSDWCAQVGAFSGFPPLLLAWLLAPSQARPFGRRLHRHLVEIGHLGMAGLNATETALHLVAVLQLPFGNPFLQSGKDPLDCCSSFVLSGNRRSRHRYRRVSLILPSSMCSRSSRALDGYQCCSIASSLPGS